MVPAEGEAAKLSHPSDAANAHRRRAITTRRLKRPDCEAEFFCIGVAFQQIGEEASSNFSCFEFLLANGGVLRDRKQAVEHFPIKRKSFLLVPRFVLRIGRDGGKLRVPISVALPEKSDGDDARDPREFWRALAPFILRRLWRTHHC